jgi:hypothetical protein
VSDTIKNSSVCVLIALAVGSLSHGLKSPYLANFLDANLILLLIALLAINTTTVSVIMTKLRELSNKPSDFTRTTRSLKVSIIEQVVLIIASIVFLMLKGSQIVAASVPHSGLILEVALLAIFCYAIHVLYDTAMGVFVLIRFEEDQGGE